MHPLEISYTPVKWLLLTPTPAHFQMGKWRLEGLRHLAIFECRPNGFCPVVLPSQGSKMVKDWQGYQLRDMLIIVQLVADQSLIEAWD